MSVTHKKFFTAFVNGRKEFLSWSFRYDAYSNYVLVFYVQKSSPVLKIPVGKADDFGLGLCVNLIMYFYSTCVQIKKTAKAYCFKGCMYLECPKYCKAN